MSTNTPDLPLNTVGTKYATALLSFVTVLATPLTALIAAPLNAVAIWQFVALGVGAVVAYLVPLTNTKWQGLLKTGFAILGAIAAAIIPLVTQEWTGQSTLIVVMAVVNILATELGVQIRTDTKVAPLAVSTLETFNVATPIAVASSLGGTIPDDNYDGKHVEFNEGGGASAGNHS